MSASIYYQPQRGTYLNVGGGKSSFLSMLERLAGPGPWEFDGSDYDRLSTAISILGPSSDHGMALTALAAAIQIHGTIRVWAEY